MITLDLSLTNKKLYENCEIEELAGKLILKTPIKEAINIIGRNANNIISEMVGKETEITLTGSMAIWAYLVIFHLVVHLFERIYYADGKGNKVLVAAHG